MNEYFFNNRNLAYRKNEFRADRPTIVCIHGLSGSASAWFPYEKSFSEKYNLLTFDLRGHGKSKKYTDYAEYELKKFADDLYELIEYLSIQKCTLLSHSFGTLAALEFLHAHPEKVSSAVFLSPTAFLNKTLWFPIIKVVGGVLVILYRFIPFHPTIVGRVDYSPLIPSWDWDLRRIPKDLRATSVRVYTYCLTHAYAKNFDPMWKDIHVPTLLIHGNRDSIIPVHHSELLMKEIRGSTLVVLEHANHILVINNVPEIANHIEAFVQK